MTDLDQLLRAGDDAPFDDPEQRGPLLDLDAFPMGCVEPRLGHAVLCELDLLAAGGGTPSLEPHLAECAACAVEVADAREALAELDAPPRSAEVSLRCVYCHDGLEVEAATYCAKCLAVHHADCFEEHGSCATLGCGETRWVRSTPLAVPPGLGVRLAGTVLALAGLTAAALGGVAFYTEQTRREQLAVERIARLTAERNAREKIAELEREVQRQIALRQYQTAAEIVQQERAAETQGAEEEVHKALVKQLLEKIERAKADEVLYREAIELIERGEYRYPIVRSGLVQIDPASAVYADAQAYLGWLEADRLLRDCRELLTKGQAPAAIRTLRPLLEGRSQAETASLGSEARAALLLQRGRLEEVISSWEKGVAVFERGKRSVAEGSYERARLDLLEATELLGRNTAYGKEASDLLEKLPPEAGPLTHLSEQDLAIRALNALRREDWKQANRWLHELSSREAHDYEWATAQVAELEAKLQLHERVERGVKDESSARYADLLELARLLARWLPESHPKRASSERLRVGLEKRIGSWTRQR